MKPCRYRRSVVAAAVLGSVGVTLTAQNGSQFKDWRTAALSDPGHVKPRDTCGSLVALTGYEFSVTSATTVPASADAPDHCRVSGQIQPEVRFEVSLPAVWNGRFYMFGNGGYAGEALDAPARVATTRGALSRGFAVAQMNTGHDAAAEPLGTFAASPQKFLDYAYRGVHVTVLTAKRILQAYYDGPLRHSYFDGCSTGGRQGLISAQRFPEDFDGILVGAPVLNFSGTMIGYVTSQRALMAAPISREKLKVLGDVVYAKCDASDGLTDGLIDDQRVRRIHPTGRMGRERRRSSIHHWIENRGWRGRAHAAALRVPRSGEVQGIRQPGRSGQFRVRPPDTVSFEVAAAVRFRPVSSSARPIRSPGLRSS